MPPIERYQKRYFRTGETGEVEASAEQFSASGKAIASIGGALSEVVDGMTKAQEHQQKTQALNNAKMMKADIVARFAADPDPNNYDQYVAELTDVSGKASEGITLRNAKSAFDLDFSSEANSGLMEMNKLKRTKIVELGAMAVQQELDMYDQDFLSANTPEDEARALMNSDMALENGMANGYMTPKEADAMREKRMKELGSEKVGRQMNQAMQTKNADQIKAIKENLLSGVYEQYGVEISASEKRSLISTLDSAVKKIDQEVEDGIKLERATNDQSLTKKVLEENFTDITEIRKMQALGSAKQPGGISDGVASSLIRYINDPVVQENAESRNALMYAIPEKYFDIDSDEDQEADKDARFEKIAGFRNAALDAYQSGAISKEQLTEKFNATEQVFQSGLKGVFSQEHKNGQVAWKFYKDWFSKNLNGLSVKEAGKTTRYAMSEKDMQEGLTQVGLKLMERMRQSPITDAEIPTVTQDILKRYLVTKYPELANKVGTPSAVVSNGSVWDVGGTDAKADEKRAEPLMDYKTAKAGDVIDVGGKKYRVVNPDPTGDHEVEEVK
jgi:hypothetical protein